ncbi:MAG: PilU, Type pilus twitching motility protein [Pseudomonadota bacterium]|jgi:twitching motility protein PilU
MSFNQNKLHDLLAQMLEKKASDLLINSNFPPAVKVDGELILLSEYPLTSHEARELVLSSLNDKTRFEFKRTLEANFSLIFEDLGRFRVSAFMQQGIPGMVIRATNSCVPSFYDLHLPSVLENISLSKRGIVLVTGATGSGKTTSLAAMIDYRNTHSQGHIISIEDPIEFSHTSKKCMLTQREVGMDTQSWHIALKNTLRQAPDMIVLGEIRDRETMEYAIQYAETGHLCIATLHANNANQAIDRVLSFFPRDQQRQVLVDLSLNLRAIVSQRLIRKQNGGRVPAVEVMTGTPLVADLIFKGEIHALKDAIKSSKEQGMICFDDALFDLYEGDKISYEEALKNADSENDLRLKIKLHSKRSLDTKHIGNLNTKWQLV